MTQTKLTKAEAAAGEKIATFDEPNRTIAGRLHEIILGAAPELRPKLYDRMPGYTLGGPVIVFFRVDDGQMSLGTSEHANITVPDGAPDRLVQSAWFLDDLDAPTEARIAEIVRRAVS